MKKPIPEGFNTLTPSLILNNAAKAIEVYKRSFGARELYRMEYPGSGGKIMHACLEFGNSKLFLADTNEKMGCSEPSVTSFYVYVENVDDAFKKASDAGLKQLYPVSDMFWGDRTGTVEDEFGIKWTLATFVREVSRSDMEKGRQEFSEKVA
jgi:uncharacterized glyoxalase superfamily protein PhnB